MRLTSVRALADGGSLSRLTVRGPAGALVKAPNPKEMVVMGIIRKAASIMMLIGVSSHTRREPPGKAERARAKAERAEEKAAQAQAVRAEADAKVAGEQAAVLARALHEDEVHRQADLREVAEKEAEAVPEWPPGS